MKRLTRKNLQYGTVKVVAPKYKDKQAKELKFAKEKYMSGVIASMRRAAKEFIISKQKTSSELYLQTTVSVRAPPK